MKTDGQVVVAARYTDVVVFDYATTAVLRSFRACLDLAASSVKVQWCLGVALTADKHVLVADSDACKVLKFALDGVYVGDVFSSSDAKLVSVTETEAGEIIVADDTNLKGFLIQGPGRVDECLTPPSANGFEYALAVVSQGEYVYALDTALSRVFVYE